MKRGIAIFLSVLLMLSLAACGADDGMTATVQTVGGITGMGSIGLSNRFSGLTVASVEEKIYKDENSEIASCEVQVGDHVEAGDLLFTYDMEAMQLSLEKAELEIARLENTIAGLQDQLETLKKDKEKASSSQQLSYSLEIQSTETSIREEQYNLSVKQKAFEQQQASMGDEEVYAPISGRVQTINDQGGYDDYGRVKPYITLLDTSSFRIEGTINEMNMASIYEGMPVVLRSRVNSDTWNGYIAMIDYDNPVQNQNMYYYDGGDSSAASSKYHFYVEPESCEGLMLGQHVYIELDNGEGVTAALCLPEYYLNEINGDSAWVWAATAKDTLEKRTVTLGAYDEMMGTYEILSGLTVSDAIAFPDENWKAGMKVTYYTGYEENDSGLVTMPEAAVPGGF